MLSRSIVLAFSEAAAKLAFGFEPHFEVTLPDGATVRAVGLVREFGSPNGTVLFCEGSEPSLAEQAALKAMGYFYSVLFPSHARFVESHFKDTLNDWGYFGNQASCPSWYTGQSWSH